MSKHSIGLEGRLGAYLVAHEPPEHPVLAEIRAVTASMPNAMMQIAPEQGAMLAFLARTIGARMALEVGTFTGYSALAVALALPADGRLVACDVSEEWTSIGRPYWKKAGVAVWWMRSRQRFANSPSAIWWSWRCRRHPWPRASMNCQVPVPVVS